VAYSLVAVDFLQPQVLHQQMLHVLSQLAAGHIKPLPTANYSMTSVVAAMRLLAQASHIGKVSVQRALLWSRGLLSETTPTNTTTAAAAGCGVGAIDRSLRGGRQP
jgi:hypothetical protein